jgi:hypothetical protein
MIEETGGETWKKWKADDMRKIKLREDSQDRGKWRNGKPTNRETLETRMQKQ